MNQPTKSPLEMLLELRQIRDQLTPEVRHFVDAVQTLVDEGMDDAIDVDTLRKIYMKLIGVRGLPTPKTPQQSFPPFPQMVEELNTSAMMLINDNDRDFIAGLAMLIEMQEQITASDMVRLQKLYLAFKEAEHMGSTICD